MTWEEIVNTADWKQFLAQAIADASRAVVAPDGTVFFPEATRAPDCECGSDALGSPKHSTWCPKQ